jgi:hypothetical protein
VFLRCVALAVWAVLLTCLVLQTKTKIRVRCDDDRRPNERTNLTGVVNTFGVFVKTKGGFEIYVAPTDDRGC